VSGLAFLNFKESTPTEVEIGTPTYRSESLGIEKVENSIIVIDFFCSVFVTFYVRGRKLKSRGSVIINNK